MRSMTYVLGASGIGGVIFAILAGIRWAFEFPDPSQLVFGAGLGIAWAIMSFGFSYLYERVSDLRQKQRYMDERWDSYIQGKKGEEDLEMP